MHVVCGRYDKEKKESGIFLLCKVHFSYGKDKLSMCKLYKTWRKRYKSFDDEGSTLLVSWRVS